MYSCILIQSDVSLIFRVLLSVVAALSCWGYMLGFLWSIDINEGFVRWCILLFLQLILQPVFAILEISGVVYAILSPPIDGFHIVQKERSAQLAATQSDPTLAAAARAAFEQSGENDKFAKQAADAGANAVVNPSVTSDAQV